MNEEIDWILKGKEKNKADLFGKTRMVLDDLNFEDLNPPKGTLLRYTGLAGRDKILLSKRADMQELGAAAAHELGHKRYGLEEPLGYALSYAYQYANGILERKELIELLGEEQSMQNKDHNSIKGLEIVIDASRYGNRWNDYFWKRVRSLARKPVFQWKKQPLKTR
ncbi:MAG: hypothetical protein NTY48_02930 [Candidatus Diapherotrites archaeon]|nr:hypothetical protein [Candidatus Diapherotrites archaeon]